MYTDCLPILGQIYSDFPGKVLAISSYGMKYQWVFYDYDNNAILVEPMKSPIGPEMKISYKVIHADLTAFGFEPKIQNLYNEASALLKKFMTSNDITFQITPSRTHRSNFDERSIHTWKTHFIVTLVGNFLFLNVFKMFEKENLRYVLKPFWNVAETCRKIEDMTLYLFHI